MPDSVFHEDEPPRRRSDAKVIIVVLLGLGVFALLVCAGFVGLIAVGMRQGFQQARRAAQQAQQARQSVAMPPVVVEPLEERLAKWNAAFGAPDPALDEARLAPFRKFFDEVVAATSANDEARFRATVDARHFMLQVERSGVLAQLTRAEEEFYTNDYKTRWISLPGDWNRYRIVKIEMQGELEAVVYLCFWDAEATPTQVRYWLVRPAPGADWRGQDWEQVDYGIRKSYEAALYSRYASDPRAMEQIRAAEEGQQAIALAAEGKRAEASAMLLRAESRPRIPELSDHQLVGLSYAWLHVGKQREVLRCARQAKAPNAFPGVLYAQALALRSLRLPAQALAAAEQYRAAVGGGPASDTLLAQIHESLGQPAKAAEYWLKVLAFDAENASPLWSLASTADDRQAPAILDWLRRCQDPDETAARFAAAIAPGGDPKLLHAVAEFVSQNAPDSARAAFIQGLEAEAAFEYDKAADLFLSAMTRETGTGEAADQERDRYLGRYVDAMTAAGKALPAYEHAPDPKAAFRHLVANEDDEATTLPDEVLRQLIAAHCDRCPDDPLGHFQAAARLEKDGNPQEAERELRAAIDRAEGDERQDQYRAALVQLLFRAGRGIEAYDAVLPGEQAFRQLVLLAAAGPRAQELEALIARHRAGHPDDGWLDFADALLLRAQGDDSRALQAAQRGAARSDELLQMQCRRLAMDLAVKLDDLAAVYAIAADPDAALRNIWTRLAGADAARQGAALVAHADKHGKTPAWRYYRALEAWNAKNYAGALDAIGDLASGNVDSRGLYESQKLSEWHVRSLWHVDRKEEALRFAQSLWDEGILLPLLVVHVLNRDVDALRRVLSEIGPRPYELSSVYVDPECGPLLRDDAFGPLRREFPPGLPYLTSAPAAVLLLREPGALSSEALGAGARAVLGPEASVEPLELPPPPIAQGVTAQWVIVSGAKRLAVTVGGDRYQPHDPNALLDSDGNPATKAIPDHRGWLSIELVGGSDSASGAEADCLRLAARLLGDDCLALHWSKANRLIPNSAELRSALVADDGAARIQQLGDSSPLFRITAEAPEAERRRARFQRSLRQLISAFAERRPEQRFEIVLELQAGAAVELLHCDLTATAPAQYAGTNFLATLRAPSKLASWLTAGEPVFGSGYQVVAWEFTDGDQVRRANKWGADRGR